MTTKNIEKEVETETPEFLYRSHDYSIFIKVGNGRYYHEIDIKRDWMSDGHDYEVLVNHGFKPCTKDDFEELEARHALYQGYKSYSRRNDGHGGVKGGTMEEYLDYMQRVEIFNRENKTDYKGH